MHKLHIANLFFENELSNKKKIDHQNYYQLQFLPLLYMDQDDSLLVSSLPPENYLAALRQKNLYFDQKIYTFKSLPKTPHLIESWGASQMIQNFAAKYHHQAMMPNPSIVKKWHAKDAYLSPNQEIEILHTEKEVIKWAKKTPGPKVIKELLSFAGKNRYIFEILSTHHLKKMRFPLRCEKWLNRSLDFSTQWLISDEIEFLGAVQTKNSKKGVYQTTYIGQNLEPYLSEHLACAYPLLESMKKEGYFGNVGLDAFVYDENKLYSICEINARKTMSLVMIKFWQKHFSKGKFCFSYGKKTKSDFPYLPQSFQKKWFSRQIQIDRL